MIWIWIGIFVALVIIELTTINLTTIWYVLSSIAAMLIALNGGAFITQFAVFVIGGTILLITTRPIIIKFLRTKDSNLNIDRIIGMTGKVIKDIEYADLGEVKVDGKIWFAYSDDEIKENELVEILEIKGTKLKVRKK